MPEGNSRPFSIRMFLPDGDPDGLRVVEKSNWTGVGLVFGRAIFKDASRREEMGNPGVYVLAGFDEARALPTIYVGEADVLRNRMANHHQNKDFWTWAACFTAKDAGLNKAHVRYLEHRLIERARAAKQANVENAVDSAAPALSEADRADMDSYLEDMLSIFPVLGLTMFDKREGGARRRTRLSLSAKGVTAEGFEDTKGFVVARGSQAVAEAVPSAHEYMVRLRRDLIDQGVLRPDGDALVFTEDYTFGSPSTAGGVVLGRATNGRLDWRDAQGRTLKELQAASAAQEPGND